MRLISVNLNGIRSADSKGFFPWLKAQEADVVCLQETRIQPEQLTDVMLEPEGLKSAFEFAVKRGYSGVGLYFKKKTRPHTKRYRLGRNGHGGSLYSG